AARAWPADRDLVRGLRAVCASLRIACLARQGLRGAVGLPGTIGQAWAGPAGAVGGACGLRIGASARLHRPYDAQYRRDSVSLGAASRALPSELRSLVRSFGLVRRWLFLPLLGAGLAAVCATLTQSNPSLWTLIPLYSAPPSRARLCS